ncbi:molybdopterin-dependent oxidoreductase [Cohnella thermotolerans]|uniref:molybdopterin-dependent oxidoreductase n=1 Tax=Cohnella thermotolerans TaxID=329858 RepID=UPI0004793B54|nr:molybdopterin-dependent oxidoreductase [Cohnella thermotolerans]
MSGGKKRGIGKQLAELHRWNAWLIVALAASGLILSWGAARGWLGEGRVWVKQLHIYIGLVTAVLLALYAPLAKRHLKQLRNRPRQKGNLAFVVALLAGWLLSGIVLWQIRLFPPHWANYALLVHDLSTWIGLPYAAYHSITRLRWLKKPERRAVRPDVDESVRGTEPGGLHPAGVPQPWMTRRQFVRWSVGIAITAAVGPSFIRWAGKASGVAAVPGGMTDGADPNRMLPAPDPLPDSTNVIGGGAQGRFRIYTVTPLPTFDSADWTFTVDGLVERPMRLGWEQFLKLKRAVQVSDFHCVTGWSVYKNTWEGVRLSELLAQAGAKPEAKYVKFYSGDGEYTDALSMEQAAMDDVLVAVLHDGKPIHRDYGGPVRLIVPQMYAYKSVKWLQRIELIREPHTGYWELRGYDNDAWV